MKRVYERLLFIGIGALIALLAYTIGNVTAQDNLTVGVYDAIKVKNGIIVGDTKTKGSPMVGIIVDPTTDIGTINLGISDGKGSIAIDDSAIMMTIGSNSPPSLQVTDRHGSRVGIILKDGFSHIVLFDGTGEFKTITTE